MATCCHHRCEWQHYVGQDLFHRCGFSPQDFAIISWMTGWALCGHEAPDLPPHTEVDGTDDHDTGVCTQRIPSSECRSLHAMSFAFQPCFRCAGQHLHAVQAADGMLLISVASHALGFHRTLHNWLALVINDQTAVDIMGL